VAASDQPVMVPCVGGSHDGHEWPMHPLRMREGAVTVMPSHTALQAMIDAPEREPVVSGPDSSWERYVIRKQDGRWVLVFDGNIDHLPPPATPPWA
jgi:hypothetical protein